MQRVVEGTLRITIRGRGQDTAADVRLEKTTDWDGGVMNDALESLQIRLENVPINSAISSPGVTMFFDVDGPDVCSYVKYFYYTKVDAPRYGKSEEHMPNSLQCEAGADLHIALSHID